MGAVPSSSCCPLPLRCVSFSLMIVAELIGLANCSAHGFSAALPGRHQFWLNICTDHQPFLFSFFPNFLELVPEVCFPRNHGALNPRPLAFQARVNNYLPGRAPRGDASSLVPPPGHLPEQGQVPAPGRPQQMLRSAHERPDAHAGQAPLPRNGGEDVAAKVGSDVGRTAG